MATVDYPHLSADSSGALIIAGTRLKVLVIAMEHVGQSWDAQELQRQHPDLTLGQIHSALGYYYDHQPEMDAEMEEDLREADRLMAKIEALQGPSSLDAKLRAAGQRP